MKPVLPWQASQWQRLCGYVRQQRVPQALLISGNKGLGKRALAERFASLLLCLSPSDAGDTCGRCKGCQLHAVGNHPDFFTLIPDEPGKAIAIDRIRDLIADMQLKPQYAAYRVVIIDPADQLNRNSANAFLKCLEEPAERTVILLITAKPAALPMTIASRCQKLGIAPPDRETVTAWLRTQSVSDPEAFASLAQNSPFVALDYANANALISRNDCLKTWIDIAKRRASPVLIAEDWQKLPLPMVLAWLCIWVGDSIKFRFYRSASAPRLSSLELTLQELSERLDLKSLYRLYDLLLAARVRLDTQVNKQMLLEEILIEWAELNRS